MVTEDKVSLYSIVVSVVMLINVFVIVYALYHLHFNYSEFKFIYFTFSTLFSIIATLSISIGYRFSSVVIYIISMLFALKVVF
jgi:hypothetical protein